MQSTIRLFAHARDCALTASSHDHELIQDRSSGASKHQRRMHAAARSAYMPSLLKAQETKKKAQTTPSVLENMDTCHVAQAECPHENMSDVLSHYFAHRCPRSPSSGRICRPLICRHLHCQQTGCALQSKPLQIKISDVLLGFFWEIMEDLIVPSPSIGTPNKGQVVH